MAQNIAAIGAFPVILGAGLVAAMLGATSADSASGPLRCTIETSRSGGMTVLQGVASADKAVDGSYQFKVTGSGTNIQQGGGFSAGPGGDAALNQVMLGGNGTYTARLTLAANGATATCERRISGAV